MQLIFLGPPGAGKGTQAARVTEHFGIAHISTGDLLRAEMKAGSDLGKQAKDYIDKGELVPDDVIIGMTEKRLKADDCSQGYLLDGFPRTLAQAEAIEGRIDIDCVINLEVPFDKLTDRISGRRVCEKCGATYHISKLHNDQEPCETCAGNLVQRKDDRPETVKNRLEVYQAQTQPLIAYYTQKGILKSINGDQSVEGVYEDIVQALKDA